MRLGFWRRSTRRRERFGQITNINLDLVGKKQRHAFISYIPDLFFATPFGHVLQAQRTLVLARTLADLGFAIDIMDCREDVKQLPQQFRRPYDLVIGLGQPFRVAMEENPQATKVIYNAELHPEFVQARLSERSAYFQDRHGRRPANIRSYKYYRSADYDGVDAVIFQGNDWTSQAFSGVSCPIYSIYPFGYINPYFADDSYSRRYERRRRFLWFGSKGVVHKGLDVLSEAFSLLPGHELVICGLKRSEEWMVALHLPNVCNLGYIDVNSDDFLRLIQSSHYVCAPSSSEGVPTSVVTCMNHGVVPLVSRETGISLNGFGSFLESFHVDRLARDLATIAEWDSVRLIKERERTFEYARNELGVDSYRRRLHSCLAAILAES